MSKAQRIHHLRILVRAAQPAIEAMPPAARADAYEAIATFANTLQPTLATVCRQYAHQLRETAIMQGTVRDLFAGLEEPNQ